jgi:hypothetical protein
MRETSEIKATEPDGANHVSTAYTSPTVEPPSSTKLKPSVSGK